MGQGARVKRLAAVQDRLQLLHGLGVSRHGAGVALGPHAGHVLLRAGLDPDGVEVRQQRRVGVGFGDDAAGHGEDHRVMGRDDAVDRLRLEGAVAFLAVERDDLGDGHARMVLDLAVEFDEGKVKRLAGHGPQGRLARPAQADQANALGA